MNNQTKLITVVIEMNRQHHALLAKQMHMYCHNQICLIICMT